MPKVGMTDGGRMKIIRVPTLIVTTTMVRQGLELFNSDILGAPDFLNAILSSPSSSPQYLQKQHEP